LGVNLTGWETLTAAVAHYWKTLDSQLKKQAVGKDTGNRSAVTGGKQMDGFCDLVNGILIANGMPEATIYVNRRLELPGFFRPTKRWDMVVVSEGHLVAALEFKSQRGPSFGNNFNNRAEEAIGTAKDLWTAFREGAFRKSPRPWIGWVMLLEDCKESRQPVKADEPHFPVFKEFKNTSYAERYELLLRRLVREKLYDSAAFLLATKEGGPQGRYAEPADDLRMKPFLAALAGHVGALAASM
jgi:hypothetical protein